MPKLQPQKVKDFRFIDFLSKDPNLKRLLLVTVLTFVIMGALVPSSFLTVRNLRSMAFQFPEYGILSIAILVAMLTGGIDLSVVGIANLSGILAALVLTNLGGSFPELELPSQSCWQFWSL